MYCLSDMHDIVFTNTCLLLVQKMESMITKLMQECTHLKATSVAFPALGTGYLGFPEDRCGG